MTSQWRDHSRVVIGEAIEEAKAKGLEGQAIARHVSAAYPFGERAMHPYKIWLDEMDKQLRRIPGTRAHAKWREKSTEKIVFPSFDMPEKPKEGESE